MYYYTNIWYYEFKLSLNLELNHGTSQLLRATEKSRELSERIFYVTPKGGTQFHLSIKFYYQYQYSSVTIKISVL